MRAERDERLTGDLMLQALEGLLERGGGGKTITESPGLARSLRGWQGADRVNPPASALGHLRLPAAGLPEPGYEMVFVDVDSFPPPAPALTPEEKEELLRWRAPDDAQ
ncbi:hypothetical protein ACFY4B_27020 [Kitasatospora sp. NPDC001261]|uniref:hypothetical protein n=1 Tax=Kitasatospora sp. NPDC001261 TaxID=3364012 RepID=UPI0036CDCEDD